LAFGVWRLAFGLWLVAFWLPCSAIPNLAARFVTPAPDATIRRKCARVAAAVGNLRELLRSADGLGKSALGSSIRGSARSIAESAEPVASPALNSAIPVDATGMRGTGRDCCEID
jgi:hypothetical protein